MRATVMLAPAPDDPPRDLTTVTDDVALRGLTVARVNPAVTEEMRLPTGVEGVVVVQAEDLAARAGFQPGDLLQAINGVRVTGPGDVVAAAGMQTRVWVVDLVRQGRGMRMRFRF